MNRPKSILPTAAHKPKGLRHTSAVLFSRPGIGKTYLMTQFPNCLSIDLEGGTRMMEATAVYPSKWEELMGVLEALEVERHKFDSLSIDTADRAYDLCEQSVCRELGVATIGDAAHGKGWSLVKARWRNFVYRIVNLTSADGRKILPFFLCHEKLIPMTERRNGVPIETGRSVVSVNLMNTSKNILLPAVDFVFHLYMDEEGKRHLRTQATETPEYRIEAKGRGVPGMSLPPVIPASFSALAKAFKTTFEAKEGKAQ